MFEIGKRPPMIGQITGSQYKRYLPSAYDSSMSIYEELVMIREYLNQVIISFNELNGYVDANLKSMHEQIEWMIKELERFEAHITNVLLPENLVKILNEWFENGKLAEIINEQVFNMKADKKVVDKIIEADHINLLTYERLDGETDDTGILKRAIQDSMTTKKLINIGNKKWEFSETLDLFNNVGFVGENRLSELHYTGNSVAFNWIDKVNNTPSNFGYGCYYNTFRDLSITGLYVDDVCVGDELKKTTCFKGQPRYSQFYNVTIRKFGYFFDVDYNWTNNYENCIFSESYVWYKSFSQNNAVNFNNCSFDKTKYGFQMGSCYGMHIIGGTMEGCEKLILQPATGGGSHWSDFRIEGVYLENHGQLINTDLGTPSGTPINSWEMRNFQFRSNNVNFFMKGVPFMFSRMSSIMFGILEYNMFYKSDDSILFDMDTTPIEFNRNQYRYFEQGVRKNITQAFSQRMIDFNTQYVNTEIRGNNTKHYQGNVKAEKGFTVGTTSTNALAETEGHMLYIPERKLMRYSDGSTSVVYFQPIKAGDTSQRPTLGEFQAGFCFWDKTLNKQIVWNGTVWKDTMGTNV